MWKRKKYFSKIFIPLDIFCQVPFLYLWSGSFRYLWPRLSEYLWSCSSSNPLSCSSGFIWPCSLRYPWLTYSSNWNIWSYFSAISWYIGFSSEFWLNTYLRDLTGTGFLWKHRFRSLSQRNWNQNLEKTCYYNCFSPEICATFTLVFN